MRVETPRPTLRGLGTLEEHCCCCSHFFFVPTVRATLTPSTRIPSVEAYSIKCFQVFRGRFIRCCEVEYWWAGAVDKTLVTDGTFCFGVAMGLTRSRRKVSYEVLRMSLFSLLGRTVVIDHFSFFSCFLQQNYESCNVSSVRWDHVAGVHTNSSTYYSSVNLTGAKVGGSNPSTWCRLYAREKLRTR